MASIFKEIERNYEKLRDRNERHRQERLKEVYSKLPEIKEIDFNIQKAILQNIKRTSETSCEIEFELNSGKDKNVNIRDFNFYSKDVKEINSEFDGNKAIIKLEFGLISVPDIVRATN